MKNQKIAFVSKIIEFKKMNGTNSTYYIIENYGGIAFFVHHLSEYLPDTIFCLVGAVFGILGKKFF
jgi:hypothetical protein